MCILTGMWLSVKAGKLTVAASVTAGIVGFLVLVGGGYAGLSLLVTFFVLGVLATRHQRANKAQVSGNEPDSEKRKASQVLANGGVAAMVGLISLLDPTHRSLYVLMMAASLSAATADTLSSELGTVYGKRFFNILHFRKEERGLDGVVSVEGTLLGLAGSTIIAGIYALFVGLDRGFLVIMITGTAGNLFDSVLGAALERKQLLHNDLVNLFTTLFAALLVLLFR